MNKSSTFFQRSGYLIAMAAIASLCGLANAQIGIQTPATPAPIEGPTLEETTKWIKEKGTPPVVTYIYGSNGQYTHSTRVVLEFNECVFTIRTENRDTQQPVFPNTNESWIVDVIQLDRESMVVYGSSLKIYTIGGRKAITRQGRPSEIFSNTGSDTKESKLGLFLPDRELAERMKNAMQHVIKLCIKQAEDRKAAEPPRPKEIF